jgi:hypothetical protein
MSNSKTSNKTFLSRVCKILSPDFQARIVCFLSPFLRKSESFCLPEDITSAKSAVILMPGNSADTGELIKTLLSISHLLPSAKIMIVCESSVENSYKSLKENFEIITYEEQNCFLFSREMNALKSVLFGRECDLCISLDQNPHIALIHLLSGMSPKIRAGFDGSGSDFFFNLRFREKPVSEKRTSAPCFSLAAFLGCTFPSSADTDSCIRNPEEAV